MNPQQILTDVRRMIADCAHSDPDEWWYANRYVFARLMLDERKTKTDIKRELLSARSACALCGKDWDEPGDIHLHRVDDLKGYSIKNCVLTHADCHRKWHRSHPRMARGDAWPRSDRAKGDTTVRKTAAGSRGRRRELRGPADSIVVKHSRVYHGSFRYWWDITPGLGDDLGAYEAVQFVCSDTGMSCSVPVPALSRFLTPVRRTWRGGGNWGIKVMKDRPGELAFEPGLRDKTWQFLPIVWLNESQED